MFDQKPIPLWIAAIMVLIALSVDAFQIAVSIFLPALGDIISALITIFFYGIYYLWFKIGYGVNFTNSKQMLSAFGGGIIEAIGIAAPADLPGLSINVILTIVFAKVPAIKVVVSGDPRAAAKAIASGGSGTEQAPEKSRRETIQGHMRNRLRSFPRNADTRRAAEGEGKQSAYRKTVGVSHALDRYNQEPQKKRQDRRNWSGLSRYRKAA